MKMGKRRIVNILGRFDVCVCVFNFIELSGGGLILFFLGCTY